MSRFIFLKALVLVAALAAGTTASSCGKKGDTTPTGPTGSTPTPSNPGTVVTQNGCSVTYACPNVDINGAANPSTPTFDTVTLSTGTSANCRADLLRNSQGPALTLQFTIRNPSRDYYWDYGVAHDTTLMGGTPTNGSADAAGPFQGTSRFGFIPDLRSGITVTQNLVLDIHRSAGANLGVGTPLVAACGVTVWGYVRPGG